ncbi:uncharacterized protein LOC117175601 [Belonocnema kinseyi]|uniref:uncharacterized protein LOC117175601 n=1 Tax=Belonocnema kinseyi TaxID=2817044 RepID=UPI00143D6221|nr:uncharacterized protein LOC117175601 [Belonocnema kinseyi]
MAEETNKSQETNNQKETNYEEDTTESEEENPIPGKKKRGGTKKNRIQGKNRKFDSTSTKKKRGRPCKNPEQTLDSMRKKNKKAKGDKVLEEVKDKIHPDPKFGENQYSENYFTDSSSEEDDQQNFNNNSANVDEHIRRKDSEEVNMSNENRANYQLDKDPLLEKGEASQFLNKNIIECRAFYIFSHEIPNNNYMYNC